MNKIGIGLVVLFGLIIPKVLGLPKETDLRSVGFPLVHLLTVDSVVPPFEEIYPPEGCFGASIQNNEYVKGRVYVTFGDSLIYDSGDYMKDSTGGKIRVRGNASALCTNPSYKIKLEMKANLFTGKNVKSNKDFLLLNSAASKSFNRPIGNCVANICGIEWMPDYQYVNVFLNGRYLGLYILSEMIERGNLKSEVSKSGYILNNDAYWWTETDTTFQTGLHSAMGWTFKYPEMQDLDSARLDYIKKYIEGFEAELKSGGDIEKWIDVESFAAWVLAHDILGTFDAGGSNMYVLKKDTTPDTKLKMGPLWDFDTSLHIYQLKYKWSKIHGDDNPLFYYGELFRFPVFVEAYVKKWNEVKDVVEEECLQVADSLFFNYREAIDQSRKYAYQIDYKSYNKAYTNYSAVNEWFSVHLPWLETEIKKMEEALTSSEEVIALEQKFVRRVYVFDLSGRLHKIVHSDNLSDGLLQNLPQGCYVVRHYGESGEVLKEEKVCVGCR